VSAASPIVASLVEFYSIEEIRVFWQQVFNARMARSTSPVTITNSSFEGGSAGGIVLNTPQEMDAFITACRAAIRLKHGDNSTPSEELGRVVDFSHRAVSV
jgi:hypothetical protein